MAKNRCRILSGDHYNETRLLIADCGFGIADLKPVEAQSLEPEGTTACALSSPATVLGCSSASLRLRERLFRVAKNRCGILSADHYNETCLKAQVRSGGPETWIFDRRRPTHRPRWAVVFSWRTIEPGFSGDRICRPPRPKVRWGPIFFIADGGFGIAEFGLR